MPDSVSPPVSLTGQAIEYGACPVFGVFLVYVELSMKNQKDNGSSATCSAILFHRW
jgi:hypothetical protein